MMSNTDYQKKSEASRLAGMWVIPAEGHDSTLLDLSDAHGPFFTGNIVIMEGETGRVEAAASGAMRYPIPVRKFDAGKPCQSR